MTQPFQCVNIICLAQQEQERLQNQDQIKSFVNLKHIKNVSSIRSSQGDVYFCDLSVQIIKRKSF